MPYRPPILGIARRKVAELGVAKRARSPDTRKGNEKGAEGGTNILRFVRALQAPAAWLVLDPWLQFDS